MTIKSLNNEKIVKRGNGEGSGESAEAYSM